MPAILDKLLDKYNKTLDASVVLNELELNPEVDKQFSDKIHSRCPLHDSANNRNARMLHVPAVKAAIL
jgi:hypothetical protein